LSSQMAVVRGFHGRAAPGQPLGCKAASKLNAVKTDPACRSVDDGVQLFMQFSRQSFLHGFASLPACDSATGGAQNSPASAFKPQAPAPTGDAQTRITIEVTGGEKGVPVENASVYVKFIEEHAIKKTRNWNECKDSRDGIAHVPNAPWVEYWFKLSRRMEDVWTLARPHRPERHQCISRGPRVVLKKSPRSIVENQQFRKIRENSCPCSSMEIIQRNFFCCRKTFSGQRRP